MEELRKKCHTDDDSKSKENDQLRENYFLSLSLSALWLDQSKTLRQQEIDEQSTVVLRRKYFFSDTNIDQRDPIQLNLLYVQVKKTKIFLFGFDETLDRWIFSVETESSMELIQSLWKRQFNSLVFNVKLNSVIFKNQNTNLIFSSKIPHEKRFISSQPILVVSV